MTGDQYKLALKRLGLTQHQAGDLLALDKDTSAKWAQGKHSIHPCAVVLLALLLANKPKITIADVAMITKPAWWKNKSRKGD